MIPIWRKFGKAVKIDKNMLDNFAKNCSPEECIVEMLDYWLRNCTRQPTWNDVAKTLNIIGLHKLAIEIDKISTTGTYYDCIYCILKLHNILYWFGMNNYRKFSH